MRTSLGTAIPGFFLAGMLAACSSSGKSGPAQLAVNLVDAPNPAVDQIVVNVTKVTAHSTAGGWTTVGPVVSPTTVDLLTLQNSFQALGLVKLPAGKITEVRLYVSTDGDYVMPVGTTTPAPLVVPSGYQSGIKILGPWDVPACSQLTLTLDFDGKNSIEYHQADGTWILRPVIRPKKSDVSQITCEDGGGGQTCNGVTPCAEGQFCSAGTCVASNLGGPSSPCTSGLSCLSSVCGESGTCAPGPAGAPCLSPDGCASGTCDPANNSCAVGPAGTAGSACTSADGCMSGNCSGLPLSCQPGGQGAPCLGAKDCQSTPTQLTCTSGFCQP